MPSPCSARVSPGGTASLTHRLHTPPRAPPRAPACGTGAHAQGAVGRLSASRSRLWTSRPRAGGRRATLRLALPPGERAHTRAGAVGRLSASRCRLWNGRTRAGARRASLRLALPPVERSHTRDTGRCWSSGGYSTRRGLRSVKSGHVRSAERGHAGSAKSGLGLRLSPAHRPIPLPRPPGETRGACRDDARDMISFKD